MKTPVQRASQMMLGLLLNWAIRDNTQARRTWCSWRPSPLSNAKAPYRRAYVTISPRLTLYIRCCKSSIYHVMRAVHDIASENNKTNSSHQPPHGR